LLVVQNRKCGGAEKQAQLRRRTAGGVTVGNFAPELSAVCESANLSNHLVANLVGLGILAWGNFDKSNNA